MTYLLTRKRGRVEDDLPANKEEDYADSNISKEYAHPDF